LTHGPGKPKPRASATSSDASAVKREAEEAVELEPVTQQSAMVKNYGLPAKVYPAAG
jgi:hypothetical protein